MTRKERLERTLRGEPVDRPAVSFYEIDGNQDTQNADPFNVFNSPDWQPIIDLAREESDRMVSVHVPVRGGPEHPLAERTITETWSDANGSRFTRTTLKAGKRTLTHRSRRDPHVNTVWTEEHFLKDTDDLKAYLDLPAPVFGGTPDPTRALQIEQALGDAGIIRIETGTALCAAADLFDMATYTIIALTEPKLFTQLLERFESFLLPSVEAISRAMPGRMWRMYGPEYASPPYLPPRLFREYVTTFDAPIARAIQEHGGFARLHSHGNLRDILDDIVATGCDGLDPIEPAPQGDVTLADVRERCGDQLVLFGNLEASDLENLPTPQFEEKIRTALDQGPGGKGFVLMPSACPYGRELSPHVLPNYQAMVRLAKERASSSKSAMRR
jgi:hypothetical protein